MAHMTAELDTILTGEAVALEARPAGVMIRTAATLLDFAVYALVWALVVLGLLGQVLALNEAQMGVVSIGSVAGIVLLVPTAIETLTGGRSLGKIVTGTRVVRDDGGPIRFRHAVTRWSTAMVELVLTAGFLAFVVAMLSPRSKRLGDMLAGTYVARVRGVEERDHPLIMPPELAAWAYTADMAALPDRVSLYARKYLARTATLAPHMRHRLALSLAAEVEQHVSPPPPPGTHPERFLAAVLVARRDREYAVALRRRGEEQAELEQLGRLPHGL